MSLRVIRRAMLALTLHAVSSTASAQAAVEISMMPAGTPLVMEIAEPLASSTHKRGDTFAITLVEPLLVDGVEIVPAGSYGTGEIIHAAPARGGGAPGELLIAARTLDTPHGQLQLRGFKLGATGGDNSGMALGVSVAIGAFAMFIRGHEIVIPAGTRGIVRTKNPPSVTSSLLVPATQATIEVRNYVEPQAATATEAETDPAIQSRPDIPVQP
jgi:hypothetical protein